MICLIAQKMLTLMLLGTIVATDCRVMLDMAMIYCGAGQMKIRNFQVRVVRKILISTPRIDQVVACPSWMASDLGRPSTCRNSGPGSKDEDLVKQ